MDKSKRILMLSCFNMRFQTGKLALVLLVLLVGSTSVCVCAQDQHEVGMPPRAPGYALFYHNDGQPMAYATRWGYYDGWTDGRHDRELGHPPMAKEQDRYKVAPAHGESGRNREAYKAQYRSAYLHGYDQGIKQ